MKDIVRGVMAITANSPDFRDGLRSRAAKGRGVDDPAPSPKLRVQMSEHRNEDNSDLKWFCEWIDSLCDGEWEKGQTFRMGMYETAEWRITVNFEFTSLEGVAFSPVLEGTLDEDRWMEYQQKGTLLKIKCSLHRLPDTIRLLRTWVEANPNPNYKSKTRRERHRENVALALKLHPSSCPRRYCWWWDTLSFDWSISVADGCTFITERDKGEKGAVDMKWRNRDSPCCRCDPTSKADHYERREPHLMEDGIDIHHFDNKNK